MNNWPDIIGLPLWMWIFGLPLGIALFAAFKPDWVSNHFSPIWSFLDRTYTAAGYLAALFMCIILLITIGQMSSDELGASADGQSFEETDAESEVQGGRVLISASGNVINQAVTVDELYNIDTGALGIDLASTRSAFIGGEISSLGGTTIVAEGEVQNIGSEISSLAGDTFISAVDGFYQENVSDTYLAELSAFGNGGQNIVSVNESYTNQSAQVTGQNVTIVSKKGNIESIGYEISAKNNAVLYAENGNVNLETVAIVTNSGSVDFVTEEAADASATIGSGEETNSFDYSAQAEASASGAGGVSVRSNQQANFITSSVTGGDNVTIYAGGSVTGVGAELSAEFGNLDIYGGESVELIRAQTEVNSSSYQALVGGQANAGASTTNGLADLPEAHAGAQATLSLGRTQSTNTESSSALLNAGQNINIQSGGNLVVQSDIFAGGDAVFDAQGLALVQATQERSSSSETDIDLDYGVNVSVGGDLDSSPLNGNISDSTTNSTTYREQDVNVTGQFVVRSATDDVVIEGITGNVGSTYFEGENVTFQSVQDQIDTTQTDVRLGGGFFTEGPAAFSKTDTQNTVTTDLSSLTVTDGNFVQNARSGDAIIRGAKVTVESGDLIQQALNGTAGFEALENVTDTNTVGVALSVESITGELSVEGLIEGVGSAIVDGRPEDIGRTILNTNPVLRNITTLAAGIETNDPNLILSGINPLAGQIFGVVDQAAYDGQLTETALAQGGTGGTGATEFLNFLNGGPAPNSISDETAPPTNYDPSALTDAIAEVADINVGAGDLSDLIELNGDVDVRLGVTVTDSTVRETEGAQIDVNGNVIQTGNFVVQAADNSNITGDLIVNAQEGFSRTGGYRSEDTRTVDAGVTVGFDVINQDVRVGVDAEYTEGRSTQVQNSSLDLGGNLLVNVADGDADFIGTNIDADGRGLINAQNVTIASPQDTESSKRYGGSATVEVGVTGDSGGGEVNVFGGESNSSVTNSITGINSNGLVINATEDVNLVSSFIDGNAGGTLINASNINATTNTDTNNSWDFNAGLAVSVNQSGEGSAGGGAEIDFGVSTNNESGPAVGSEIRGDTVVLNTTDDVNLRDSRIVAGTFSGVVGGDFNAETTQTNSNSFGLNLNVSASGQGGDNASGSGGASFGLSTSNSSTTGEASGIYAENIDLSTGGNVDLIASNISGANVNLSVGGQITESSNQDASSGFALNVGGGTGIGSQSTQPSLGFNQSASTVNSGITATGTRNIQQNVGLGESNTVSLPSANSPQLRATSTGSATVAASAAVAPPNTASEQLALASIGADGVAANAVVDGQGSSGFSAGVDGVDLNASIEPQTDQSNELPIVAQVDASLVAGNSQVSNAQASASNGGGDIGVAPSATQSAQVVTEAAASVQPQPAVNPEVALANSRASSLVRLISQAPPAVRQNAVKQIAQQLEQSPDLTSAAMLEGLNPTQKIEVLESALDVASDSDRAAIEQAIELLRVDELILGANI